MSWTDFKITRKDIDAFAGADLRGVDFTETNSGLNISETDGDTLLQARNMFETDILDKLGYLITDGTFNTETELLDAIQAVNSRKLLEQLLSWKFLELYFYDQATHPDSKAMMSAKRYNNMYNYYLQKTLSRLAGKLTPPQQVSHFEMQHTHG